MFTFLLFSEHLLLFSNWPDLLKTLSQGTEDPGIQRTALATCARNGIDISLFFYHSKGSPFICTSASYLSISLLIISSAEVVDCSFSSVFIYITSSSQSS